MGDPFYSSKSYAEVAAEVAAACAWLQDHGIAYSKTRVGRYREVFDDLVRMQAEGELDRYFGVHGFETWVNAAHEVADLVRIHRGLAGLSDPGLVDRLRKMVAGRELFSEDDQDSSGRDFGLELRLAASFAAAGMPIDLGEDGDLGVEFEGGVVYVECKRPRSRRKLESRVKKGLGQLRARYARAPAGVRPRGILALSIGKLVNPELGFLVAGTPRELSLLAGRHVERFVRRERHLWDRELDPRTVGVLVILDVPGRVGAGSRLYNCHEVVLTTIGRGSLAAANWLERLGRAAFAGSGRSGSGPG